MYEFRKFQYAEASSQFNCAGSVGDKVTPAGDLVGDVVMVGESDGDGVGWNEIALVRKNSIESK